MPLIKNEDCPNEFKEAVSEVKLKIDLPNQHLLLSINIGKRKAKRVKK